MACMTLLVPPVTMTTTQFARSIRYEVSAATTHGTATSAHELGSWSPASTAAAGSACSGWLSSTAESAQLSL